MENFFEYATGRFVNPAKIVTANVYTKQVEPGKGSNGSDQSIRVAIDLDVKEATRSTIYTNQFTDHAAAIRFILSLPVKE